MSQATWAGESLTERTDLQGATAYTYHKTSIFGRDYAGITIVGKQESQPPILRLQYGSTTTTNTKTTFSRCGQKREVTEPTPKRISLGRKTKSPLKTASRTRSILQTDNSPGRSLSAGMAIPPAIWLCQPSFLVGEMLLADLAPDGPELL